MKEIKNEEFTVEDAVNGLHHLCVDHPCCTHFSFAVVALLQKQQCVIDGLKSAVTARKGRRDTLDEALNSGDGTYKP